MLEVRPWSGFHNGSRRATSLLRLPHCHKPQAVVETRERNVGIVLVSFVSVRNCFFHVACDLSGIRTRRSTANILITLALDDESRETRLTGPKEALDVELATHCREGTWSCEVELAGTQGFVPIPDEPQASRDVTESASQPRMRPQAE